MTSPNVQIDCNEESRPFVVDHSMFEPFNLISFSEKDSKEEKKKPPIKDDKDSTGAGGQTSPDNEKPPNKN